MAENEPIDQLPAVNCDKIKVEDTINDLDKDIDQDTKNESENTPEPEIKVNKRLTLQERLALAAQKKAKGKDKRELKPEEKIKQNIEKEKSISEFDKILPENYKEINRNEIINGFELYFKESRVKFEKELENEKNKSQIRLKQVDNTGNSEFLRKLEEKENQVKELMDEGIKLSKKEVGLTQTIKKMKQKENELEDDLEKNEKEVEMLQNKNNELENQLISFRNSEKSIKEEKLLRQSFEKKYNDIFKEKEQVVNELKELKLRKLDIQLEEKLKSLEEETKRNMNLERKLNLLSTEFNNFKTIKNNELVDAENKLEKEKNKLNELTRDNDFETKRLEEKLEKLRIQSENSVDKNNDRDNNKNSIGILQAQYDQSQENWRLIESSYLEKISNYENEIEILKDNDIKQSKKIKVLNSDLKKKLVEFNESIENEENLRIEIDSIKNIFKTIKLSNETLNESLNQFKKDYEKEKISFENKVQILEDEKTRLEETLRIRTEYSSNGNNSNINNNNHNHCPSNSSLYLQDLPSSSSSLNYYRSINTPSNKRLSISLGESSTTPRPASANSASQLQFNISKLNNSNAVSAQEKVLAHQNSIMSIDYNANDMDGSFDNEPHSQFINRSSTSNLMSADSFDDGIPVDMDTYTLDDHSLSISNSFNNLNSHGNNGNNGSMNAGPNIQMVSKLSAHVRRLELEVVSLKEEIKDLTQEKEDAGNEIIKLMSENENVSNYKDEINKLNKELEQLQIKYDRMLVLLGEKEEKVGELTADVDDLKDLLRQQVQQMVEMQEKINLNNIS